MPLFARPEPEPKDRRRFSRTQVFEATTATILAASVLGTAGGVMWLIAVLPNELHQLRSQIEHLVKNQAAFTERFNTLEKNVSDHDRRIIRLELR